MKPKLIQSWNIHKDIILSVTVVIIITLIPYQTIYSCMKWTSRPIQSTYTIFTTTRNDRIPTAAVPCSQIRLCGVTATSVRAHLTQWFYSIPSKRLLSAMRLKEMVCHWPLAIQEMLSSHWYKCYPNRSVLWLIVCHSEPDNCMYLNYMKTPISLYCKPETKFQKVKNVPLTILFTLNCLHSISY